MTARRSNSDRVAETKGLLLDQAERLFGQQGYDATSTNELLAATGLTRGALYHHFADKRALFLTVAERLDERLSKDIVKQVAAIDDRRDRLRAGVAAYLHAVADPAVARILLIDAPSVMGLPEWRRMSARVWQRYLNGLLPEGLGTPALAAELVGALIDRAAMALAESATKGQSDILATIDAILVRLFDQGIAGATGRSGLQPIAEQDQIATGTP